MQLIDNILYITGAEFIKSERNPEGIVTKSTWDNLVREDRKNPIRTLNRGGNGRQVLIQYESLPDSYKKLVCETLCAGEDPYSHASLAPLIALIKHDAAAAVFYDRYQLPDGRLLPEDHKREYVKAAGIMRMIDHVYNNKAWLKKDLRIDLARFWEITASLKQTKDAGLPTSVRKLKPKYDAWKKDGYKALISGKFCNTNRLKVTADIENLILSLYANDLTKPYAADVLERYNGFVAGTYTLVDATTGEVFNPEDYCMDGQPVEVSKTTVWNIINNPLNRAIVDKRRLSKLEYNNTHRPHVIRHAPLFSFSKISMDDISIPFKMEDGKRAWAYQVFDVASGCVIGKAFSRSTEDGSGKNRELFKRALVDMFRLIVRNGWGMPAEIEVEQHISNTFKGGLNEAGEFVNDLLTDGHIFPFVRFCNPANPQEKRAEGFIKGKKYQVQNQREGFQRRPFSRLEANRLNEDKNKTRYSFDEVVANELADIDEWNNQPHPKQKLYPGLTRLQVLCQHLNPNLQAPYLPVVVKYVGQKTPTSINRTFATVQYGKYKVPLTALNKLDSNVVTAYYMPQNGGTIPEIYLYQGDEYVCTAPKADAFNEAKAEQTEEDIHIMHRQQGHINAFDAIIKQGVERLRKVATVKNRPVQPVQAPAAVPVPVQQPVYNQTDADYWRRKAIENL